MIVVLFAKVSAMYPRVVILSQAERLENLIFTIFYTSFGVWLRDHYMSLQMFTMGHVIGFARVVHDTLAMLRFPRVVRGTVAPLAPCRLGQITVPIPTHPSKTLPTTPLISKQVVPYWTCGGTGCSGVSTTKIRSLADSSMANHIT
jgi:hypothetical protein